MTPEQWSLLTGIVDRFGLPLAILGGLVWLLLREKLVTGARFQAMSALYERERADRIAAQELLARFAAPNADLAEAVAELTSTITKPARRRPDPYAERLSRDR